MTHEFEVRKELALDATPEQVWEAIATGPGVDSWFMGRTEIDPRVGGRNSLTMAGQTEESTVTSWEPGSHLGFRTPEGPEGTFMAFEYLIEGRAGGGTVLRLVHSGFLGDDWETEYEAMQAGWDLYLHKLDQYLTYFPGRAATTVSAFRPGAGPSARTAETLKQAMGLEGEVKTGDRVHLEIPGLDPVDGVVTFTHLPILLAVRTEDGIYGFIHSGDERGNVLVLGHHLFAGGADPDKSAQAWQAWLNDLEIS
jgi:uncharacterized protein YndB with AHSA1/START domain